MAARLRLRRLLPAPPEQVWHALTSPDALAAWFWPESFGTQARTDLRVGGEYRIAAAAAGMAVSGSYLEIEPPDRLAFTWRWDGEPGETLVTVRLTAAGPDTELVLTHEGFADDRQRDNHVQGWSDCLARLPGRLARWSAGRPGGR